MPSDKAIANERNKFRKRRNNFLRKAFELGKLCDADVAVIVHEKGNYYTYRSTDDYWWPPSIEEIDKAEHKLPRHFAQDRDSHEANESSGAMNLVSPPQFKFPKPGIPASERTASQYKNLQRVCYPFDYITGTGKSRSK
ncbi:hypothetical protein FN846DRAFT_894250 [Sphaerosporella brunnea]|uniref:MADS-box domain-containing protein n=1 Tax=Sphaerosporella brunnea TaxID=1250544 RepID=A0A5J5EJU5_9PEZI|nr:hypothetical protein FN846DRAFT_914567 [Sphaerosporella brunnea]KAA8895319.1 hypothetical protein FN846DRAFT_894250 [Sphaerosporella brunnea]